MEKLLEIINKFPGHRVGVIGDLILDRYLACEVKRISPEAPVPVAKVLDEKVVLGGAANVAANVRSLGGAAEVLGIVGMDAEGKLMLKMFKERGIESPLSFKSSGRPTTVKTRLISGNQQIVRIDKERNEIIVISDYAKGLVTESLAQEIIRRALERGIKVLSDPVPETFYKFKNSYLVKPNKDEAENIAGIKFKDDYSNADEILKVLHKKFNSNLAVTLGKEGMMISERKGISRAKSLAREVYDVSGAGDTVMAALALGLASGADLFSSCLIGNHSAGLAVGKVGTAEVSASELLEVIRLNEGENS